MDASSPSAPRHAATVLLLREREGELETLLLLRHTALKFMAGAWVFPGGGLSRHDCERAALSRLLNAPADSRAFQDTAFAPLTLDIVRSLYICACRETFEETGVLLAQHADGTPCEPAHAASLQAERAAIDRDASRFACLLEREQLFLNAAMLLYWAHWITPSALGATRFDTRFFAAALPAGQDVGDLSRESDRAQWLNLRTAQRTVESGEMHIPPPTLSTLEDVHRCYERDASVSALFAQERERAVFPILPKSIRTQSGRMLLMPWDPEYASAPGDGTPSADIPAALRCQPSRRTVNR